MNARKLGIPSLPIAANSYSFNTMIHMRKGKKSPVKPHPVTCSTCGRTGTLRKDASGKRICSECWRKLMKHG